MKKLFLLLFIVTANQVVSSEPPCAMDFVDSELFINQQPASSNPDEPKYAWIMKKIIQQCPTPDTYDTVKCQEALNLLRITTTYEAKVFAYQGKNLEDLVSQQTNQSS